MEKFHNFSLKSYATALADRFYLFQLSAIKLCIKSARLWSKTSSITISKYNPNLNTRTMASIVLFKSWLIEITPDKKLVKYYKDYLRK